VAILISSGPQLSIQKPDAKLAEKKMGSGEFLPRPFSFPCRTDWLAPEVLKYHRILGMVLNLPSTAGFVLEHVEEFHPSPAHPEWAEELERPMFPRVSVRRG
jgi:hypothetical protein